MREVRDIIAHIRIIIANPAVSSTLIQTEDLALLCDRAETAIPQSITTAPKTADEILLVSFQEQEDDSVYVSISNGCWSEEEGKFVLGKRGSCLNEIGDACATHWLPRSALQERL